MNNYIISSSKGADGLQTFETEVQPIELFLDGKWIDSVGDKSTKLYLVTLKRKSKTSITAESFEVDLEKGRVQFKSKRSNYEEKISSDPFTFLKSEYIVQDVGVLNPTVPVDLIEEETSVGTNEKIPMEPSKKNRYAVESPEEMIRQITGHLIDSERARIRNLASEIVLPTKIDLPDTIAFDKSVYRKVKEMENPTETEPD